LLLAGALCSFGTSLGRIVVWLAGLVLGAGALFSATHTIHSGKSPASLPDCWLFAVGQLVATPPKRLNPVAGAEVGAPFETLIGVALIGLFGFVLGNKIRNS